MSVSVIDVYLYHFFHTTEFESKRLQHVPVMILLTLITSHTGNSKYCLSQTEYRAILVWLDVFSIFGLFCLKLLLPWAMCSGPLRV